MHKKNNSEKHNYTKNALPNMQKENTPKFVVMQKSTKTIYTEKNAFIKNHTRK